MRGCFCILSSSFLTRGGIRKKIKTIPGRLRRREAKPKTPSGSESHFAERTTAPSRTNLSAKIVTARVGSIFSLYFWWRRAGIEAKTRPSTIIIKAIGGNKGGIPVRNDEVMGARKPTAAATGKATRKPAVIIG